MKDALIDSHCHLDDDRFDDDRNQVMQRSLDKGIHQWIIPATTARRWSKIKQISESYEGVYASYGLHPMFMQDHKLDHIAQLDSWLDQHDSVAVGECGLDFYQTDKGRVQQIDLFKAQLDLAANHRLPVIIHARKALDLILHELRRSAVGSGVIHSFSGSLQQAQQLVDLGFKLGIAATVSFERANKLRRVVREIDIDALLIETDAPDQPGAGHRGQRNEPAFMIDHLRVMAELRDMLVTELGQKLAQNCKALFGV